MRTRVLVNRFMSCVVQLLVLESFAHADAPGTGDQPKQLAPSGLRAAAITSSGETNTPAPGSASPIAIGTLYGLTVPLYTPEFFRVANGTLERVRTATSADYVQPAVYVLPSVAIWTRSRLGRKPKTTLDVMKKQWHGRESTPPKNELTDDDYDYYLTGTTLSLILPAGLTATSNDGTAVSVGIGAAFGHSIGTAAELGLALAVVWNQTPYLSDSQRAAIGMPVGGMTGVSDQIDTRLRPSLALGLYLTPTF